MNELTSVSGLVIRQQKEWGEILTGIETRNRYVVMDTQGRELYSADEEGGGIFGALLRIGLKALRPFDIVIQDRAGRAVLRVERPFRFYFHEVRIYTGDGTLLGSVKRRFSLLRRLYSVFDPGGGERLELFGPILHPWTFEIRRGRQVLGRIVKKWSGLGTEMFTDADNFGIEFPAEWPPALKAVFLGAVFLIDFIHFEDRDA